jgi:hypothetical protein
LFLYDGTTLLASNIPVTSGNFDYTLTSPLADGAHTLTVEASDAAGNFSTSTSFNVTVNTAIPPAQISGIHDDVGPVTADIVFSGGYTNDSNPVLFGHTLSGSKISLTTSNNPSSGFHTETGFINNSPNADWSTVFYVNPITGDWSFEPNATLANSTYYYKILITPPGGIANTSPVFAFTVDTVAPVVPVITGVNANEGSHTGALNPGDNTDDRTPVFHGTAEAGSTVTIKDFDGTTTTLYSASHMSGTAWDFTPAPLALGSTHTFTVTATDRAGNFTDSIPYTLNIYNAVPIPVFTVTDRVTDHYHLTQHTLANSDYTNDPSPVFSGSDVALADGTVRIYNATTVSLIATTSVAADGSWSYTSATPLAEGTFNYYLIATNSTLNVSDPSAIFTFTVDTIHPDPIALTLNTDSSHHILGSITVSGIEASSLVEYNSDGTGWDSTTPTTITAGQHSIQAHQVDSAGNVSAETLLDYSYGSGIVSGSTNGCSVIGDSGDDILSGNGNIGTHDYLYGNAGNDTIIGGHGDNTFYGGSGNNVITGGDGKNVFVAGAGSDTVHGTGSNNTLDYSTSSSAVTASFSNGVGSATHGIMTDAFDGIQGLVGSNGNDTFTIDVSKGLPTLIDGSGHDAGVVLDQSGNVMVLQNLVNGSYNMASFATVSTNIETLNIAGDGADTTLTISSQNIQQMVNNGASSQLYVNADNGDALNISLSSGQSVTQTYVDDSHTNYTISNASGQLAQVHWHHV